MSDYNSKNTIVTLEKIVYLLERYRINYRFLGSIVVAAINGKLYRNIGDLDLIVDSKAKEILYSELKKLGYKRALGIFSFGRKYLSLETLEHPSLLEVGFFYGRWNVDGSITLGNRKVKVDIESYALKETVYTLEGVTFTGLPKQTIATGIMTSKTNPKRKTEIMLLQKNKIKPFPSTYIHIHILGISTDWLYHFSMTILNILGRIRVAIGLPFDPWR